MFKLLPALFLFSLLVSGASYSQSAASPQNEPPLQGAARLSSYTLEPQAPFTLNVNLHLPKGFHAYGDKFKFEITDPEGFKYQSIKIEPLHSFFDPNTKKKKMGVIGQATLIAPMEAPKELTAGDHLLHIAITYQACTKTYCLFPTKLKLEVPFSFKSSANTVSSESGNTKLWNLSFQQAMKKGLAWTFLIVFVAGFLTSLTPCVFPMIPITIAVLGRSAHLHSKRKNFLLAVLYVLGIAVMYSALGVFAAATGAMFGSFMNHPAVLSFISIIFITMALSMFGLFEIQAPEFIRRRFSGDLHLHGYSSAFIYGIIAGVVAGPCVGPVLVGILTFVANSQNLWLGFWLLFIFSLGMGQLFLLLGFSSQLTKLLPKSGAWMDSIKKFFGLLMLGAFYYYLSLLIPARWWNMTLGLGLILLGSLSGAFDPAEFFWKKIRKGMSFALIFIGTALLTLGLLHLNPSVLLRTITTTSDISKNNKWQPYTDKALAQAKLLKKPVIIDFWADWCAACKELEKDTFSTTAFHNLGEEFILLKFDATSESEKLNELKQKYSLVGLPTILFYDTNGNWRKDLTVTEFLEAPALVTKMKLDLGKQE